MEGQRPFENIRAQLQKSESTLRRVLAHAMANPGEPVMKRKWRAGRVPKVMANTLQAMKSHLNRDPTLFAGQLKVMIPALESISIRTIQRLCHKDLNLPYRMMAGRSLLTQAVKDKQLAVPELGGGGAEEGHVL